MSFVLYDIAFLLLFTLIAAFFLYKRRDNLQRQGLMYLYRTKVGIKFIEYTTKKCSKFLRTIEPIVIFSGYALMTSMIYFLVKFAYYYISSDYLAKALKVPILLPLFPYVPELFKIDFLPPFYFTYWIIIIAIIAIPHEFAHGIFARLHKVKVHSTGFGFLGPFLAAFVEPDEKQMEKKPKKAQLSILASGTFANVLMTILFTIVLLVFFTMTFAPVGVNFNTYSTNSINTSDIIYVNGSFINEIEFSEFQTYDFISLETSKGIYYTNPIALQQSLENNLDAVIVYEDSPAFNVRLEGAITHFDNVPTTSYEELRNEIISHNPGDEIAIKTIKDNEVKEYNLTLAERDGRAFLGIGIIPYHSSGIIGWITSAISKVKDPMIYYKSSIGDIGIFIYDLLWWIVLINISVALVNMLPMGIFDGGRFFYLTILVITGNKKVAEQAFKISTWFLLALVALLMLKWFFAVF